MLPAERKTRILSILRERHEASVQALAQLLETPPANVRRDLRELESDNRIFRRHGKAVYRPTLVAANLEPETALDEAGQEGLADETLNVLSEARNLFLTGGPVMTRVVKRLSGKTIVTHDLRLALAAAENTNDISLVGRELDNRSLTLKPLDFERELADYWFDVAVIEADGLDARSVFVARPNHGIVPVLKKRCDSLVVVGKSSLVGVRADRVAAPLRDVDVLLLDAAISSETERELEHAGVELRKTGTDAAGATFEVSPVGNVYVFKRTQRFEEPR